MCDFPSRPLTQRNRSYTRGLRLTVELRGSAGHVTRLCIIFTLFFLAVPIWAAAQDTAIEANLASAVAAAVADQQPSTPAASQEQHTAPQDYHWLPALGQGFVFLVAQHSYRLNEAKTRDQLSGPFWKDYREAVRGLNGWGDGGKVFTNYIAHPAQGAVTGFIWLQNDPKTRLSPIGKSRDYWLSRLKAMTWTAAWSTQFEIGPISEASIGNVGKTPGTAGYVDLVITPIMGTALMIIEDVSERYVVAWVDAHTNRIVRKIIRPWVTPTRSIANVMRFRVPWYRDDPMGTASDAVQAP